MGDPKQAAICVVREAYKRGSGDNITATVVQFQWQVTKFDQNRTILEA
jgi:serine/threonine protein phosphatase PrpC